MVAHWEGVLQEKDFSQIKVPSVGLYFKKCLEAAQEYIQKIFKLSYDNGPIDPMGVLANIQITEEFKRTKF